MPSTSFKASWQLYVRAFGYIKSQSWLIILAGVLSVVLSVTSGVATYSFFPVFNVVFQEQGSLAEATGSGAIAGATRGLYASVAGKGPVMSQLARLVALIVGLSFASAVLALLVDGIFISVQAEGTKRLREDTFGHLTELPLVFYDKTKAGTIISRIENDIGGTVSMVTQSLSQVLVNTFLGLVFFGLLMTIHFKLTLLVLPFLMLAGLLVGMVGRLIRRNREKILALQADIVAIMAEFLGGIKIIKGFVAEEFEKKRWSKAVGYWRKLEIINNINKAFPQRLSEVVAVAIAGAVLMGGGRYIIEGSLMVAELLLFFVVLVRWQQPASALARVWWQVQDGLAHAGRAFDLLDKKVELSSGLAPVKGLNREISFTGVSFDYGEEAVIEDIDLTLRRGAVTALVGPSGSGKSTVADLLMRFYEPTRGEIMLDGQDVREFDYRSYRQLFGVVTQETFLWHDTVRENIVYGLEREVADEELFRAARAAHAHEFVMKLPRGYDTVVGDRGVRLSGGQRQRIAIARAIIRNPQVLVLDEATSSLDTQSERMVQKALDNLITSRTSLVIAHRLSTVVAADVIYVMHEGKIVQRGKHRQLVGEDGLYRHLWELQSRSEVY